MHKNRSWTCAFKDQGFEKGTCIPIPDMTLETQCSLHIFGMNYAFDCVIHEQATKAIIRVLTF